MATFEEVVKQLQMNNRSEAGRDSRHTKMLGDLKTAIEGLTVATEKPEEPAAAEEEQNKDEKSRARKLLDAVGGLKDSIGTAFTNLGKLETGVPGLTLGLLAKLAVIPLLVKFLQSDVWDKIKAFLIDPSFKELGNLFEEYTVEMTTLTAIVGGFAISKLVKVATSLASAFGAISTGLATLGGIIGLSAAATAGTLVAIVVGIVAIGKGLFDAFGVFRDTFAETGSVFESLKAGAKEFFTSAVANIALVLDGIKFVVSKLASVFGFEKVSEFLDSFSIVDLFRTNLVEPVINALTGIFSFFQNAIINDVNRILALFDFIKTIPEKLGKMFESIREFLSGADVFGGIRETLANIDIFGPVRTFLAELPDRIRELMPDVGAIFEDAKQKVLGAVDRIKDTIPVPDFSAIGDKISAIAEFFSPTRLLEGIGDAIDAKPFDFFGGGALKAALLKIFPTSSTQEEEVRPAFTGGVMQVREAGGFLGAKQFALVGEQGPELVMTKAPMQVFSEQRTDQLGMAALNRLTGGGDAGGGGSMFINQGNNVQNVSRSISPTFIVNQDTVLTTISKSLAM